MTDWPVKTLGEVCDFVSGSVMPKPGVKYQVFSVPSFDNGNPELLDGSEIKSSKRPVKTGDVLLCKINPRINRVWRVDRESKIQQIASTEWIALRCRENVLDTFLQYVLQAPSARTAMIESVTGATGSHTRAKFEIVEELEFSVPPLEEQKRIVALLDDAATHITELTTCYEQARTHVNNLFTSTLRNAMEGNPDWQMKTLGEVCEVARGTSITRKQTKEGSIPVVAGGIDVAYFHSVHNRPAGTITVSSSGANAGFVNRWDVPIFASDCSTVVAKEGGLVLGEYAFRFLQFKQGFINDELRRGSAQPHVYAKDIAAIEITVPPFEEQKRIVARLDSMKAKTSEMVAAYDAKLTVAKNLRQSILESAFAGDL